MQVYPQRRLWDTDPVLLLFWFLTTRWDEWFHFAISSCHDVLPCHKPKRNGTNELWTGICKTVNQTQLLLFMSWLSQAFCYNVWKLTNMVLKKIPKLSKWLFWVAFSIYLNHFSLSQKFCILLRNFNSNSITRPRKFGFYSKDCFAFLTLQT